MGLMEQIPYYESTPRIIEQWNNLKKILRESPSDTQVLDVTNGNLMRFKGDFFGLLKYVYHVDERHWYPTMIVNDLNSPTDFNEDMKTIILVSPDVLEDMYSRIAL